VPVSEPLIGDYLWPVGKSAHRSVGRGPQVRGAGQQGEGRGREGAACRLIMICC